jgi:hypothetical protein
MIEITNNLPEEEYKNREIIKETNKPRLCKKCQCQLPRFVKQGTKKIDCRKRMYCLTCSPFNERKMCGPDPMYYEKGCAGKRFRQKFKVDRICKTCGKIYHQSSRNLECSTCRNRKRRLDIKLKLIEYKGGKCEICGYSKCNSALEFHHKDSSTKDDTISLMMSQEYEVIKKEVDKCNLLCSNCHRELHHNEKATIKMVGEVGFEPTM